MVMATVLDDAKKVSCSCSLGTRSEILFVKTAWGKVVTVMGMVVMFQFVARSVFFLCRLTLDGPDRQVCVAVSAKQ